MIPAASKRARRYNQELTELLRYAKPYTDRELAEICRQLGDLREADRWREAADQDR